MNAEVGLDWCYGPRLNYHPSLTLTYIIRALTRSCMQQCSGTDTIQLSFQGPSSTDGTDISDKLNCMTGEWTETKLVYFHLDLKLSAKATVITVPSIYSHTDCRRRTWSLAHQHCESEPGSDKEKQNKNNKPFSTASYRTSTQLPVHFNSPYYLKPKDFRWRYLKQVWQHRSNNAMS